MSLKRCAILGLSVAVVLQFGMAGQLHELAASLLANRAAPKAEPFQVASSSVALVNVLARSALISQSVCDVIYLDFASDPDPAIGEAPLTVVFSNISDVPSQVGTVEVVEWFPAYVEGQATGTSLLPNQNLQANYEEPGTYDVGMRIRVNGQWCPPRTFDDGSVRPPFLKPGYVVVTEPGEAEQPPTATLEFSELTRDQEALVPLCDWVPLWQFTLGYDLDEEQGPALRYMKTMDYTIRGDSRGLDDLGYRNIAPPASADILEFGLFKENDAGSDSEDNLVLDTSYDRLIISWDSLGNDRLGRVNVEVTGTPVPIGGLFAPLYYTVNFLDAQNLPLNSDTPVEAGPSLEDAGIPGYSYILAVRTSAVWQSGVTLSCDVTNCVVVDVVTGQVPTDDEGEPIDSLPDFPLESESGYSSSFTVMDVTGTPGRAWRPIFYDAWNRPRFGYTPTAEWVRPKWNTLAQTFETVGAMLLDIRKLTPFETWGPVLGINLHSTKSLHFDFYDDVSQFPSPTSILREDGLDKAAAQLEEVNVVVTDMGADPAVAGSGGLDPRDGFDRITDAVDVLDVESGIGDDCTYNGVWVWHDTNNNGVFDPPTPQESGLTFNGDFPLMGMSQFSADYPNGDWEYVPFPPGGGDPWWKVKLRFLEGHRRTSDEISDAENTAGYVEAVPDGAEYSQFTPDYFVTIRADSGRRDASTTVGDGVGLPAGVDFRAFIEPRRYNPLTGTQDGGIYVNSMVPGVGWKDGPLSLTAAWQDDPRWYVDEPWWNQRTMNATTAKPLRSSVEVHDLALLYESHSTYRYVTDFLYGSWYFDSGGGIPSMFGYSFPLSGGALSSFDRWLDPFGLERDKFYYEYSVDISRWYVNLSVSYAGFPFLLSDNASVGMFPFEIAPFFSDADLTAAGPRSNLYPNPPEQPTLPEYDTWSAVTAPGQYPRITDWAPEDRQTRSLYQRTDIQSDHVALLGINLAGVDDPSVNVDSIKLNQLTVAFWGPDFKPDDLESLDPHGTDLDAGLLLWEDSDSNGVFVGAPMRDIIPTFFLGLDTPVPLRDLVWPSSPELVDVDGDYVPDDMNGDGVVDTRDRAWVLKLVPQQLWELPYTDQGGEDIEVDEGGLEKAAGDASREKRIAFAGLDQLAEDGGKALVPDGDNPGDDLFISVRFSDKARRFQKLRAVIPATLPDRTGTAQRAGIQFFPEVKTTPDAFLKVNPDEDPVQDFYGHDTVEVNVPVKVVTYATQFDTLIPGGPAKAALGIDVATNQPSNTVATGAGGTGAEGAFTVAGAAWTPNAFAGLCLIDEGYEAYEITGNNAQTLTLLSGQPRNGRWRIVRNPTFLEQLFIELYPEIDLLTGGTSGFNAEDDLLPLDLDQEISGIALYRDNDMNPANRNGRWDPGIDIPLMLDAEPDFIGQAGEPTQARFIFSTPGTDEFPVAKAQQPRHRQWVQDTFGDGSTNHPDTGPDFFLVLRPSRNLSETDSFQIGLVSWGPSTPSAPDPDAWTSAWLPAGAPPLPAEQRHEFVKFQDFPWAEHGLGFVTLLNDPLVQYRMDGAVARADVDASGINFVRSTCTKKVRSGVYSAADQPVGPQTLVIESTTPVNGEGFTELPSQILPGQTVGFTIHGQGFGTAPQVLLSGYDVSVRTVQDGKVSVTITVKPESVPTEPIVLLVRNPQTGEEASRNDLFTLVSGTMTRPVITDVSPGKATRDQFPVTISGQNFDAQGGVEVRFGRTLMPVQSLTATRVQVGFPVSGLPTTGLLDVSVRNKSTGQEDVAADGFEYVNTAMRPTKVLFCGPAVVDGPAPYAADALVMFAAAAVLWGVHGWSRRRLAARRR
ncbi:MAG: hypothetical protein KA184_17520 [Candidatus Hydrogenedentes bacterium]|nr:hypothetical protein [Candidatus Hydrogenedentota bacterium]